MLLAILTADGARGGNALWQTLIAAPLASQSAAGDAENKPAKVTDIRAELARRQAEFAAQEATKSVS